MSVFEPSGAGKVVQADNLATPDGLEGFMFKRTVGLGAADLRQAEGKNVYSNTLYDR
jgi:hypothetical protein